MKRRDFAKALVFPLAAIALTAPWTRVKAERLRPVPACAAGRKAAR
ncbi:hypothetical protein [Aquincola tertiaricarbonis]|nr:hypothetical protein [Aquincola tertiaricarbonis]